MRIFIQEKHEPVMQLPVPTGLLLNPLTTGFVLWALRKEGVSIPHHLAGPFVREFNRFRRTHPNWVLVEVESADGAYVRITL